MWFNFLSIDYNEVRDSVFFRSIFMRTAVLVFLFPEYTVHVAKSSMVSKIN